MPERARIGQPVMHRGGAGDSILFLVLRRLRAPLITIIILYAISILGLTVVPGPADEHGRPGPPMTLLHAFYFVSYTATTIGFGELPVPFSDAQRMWVIAVIHMTVIGWTYAVVTMIALFQDAAFQAAIASIRFARRVRRLGEPFLLIVGCGDTGLRLIRILDRRDHRFVVVECNAARIAELELEDFRSDAPVLHGDGSSAETLLRAGLTHRNCSGVLALTNDDHANVAVAAAARLLNPGVATLARAHTQQAADNLEAFDTEHVIDPFETFAQHLALAMRAPGCYRLHDWLTAAPGTLLEKEHEPPRGHWVVCGYGRFGKAIHRALAAQGSHVRFVEPLGGDAEATVHDVLEGVGTERSVLEQAGIAQADGLVAGTDDDVSNLAIIAKARDFNARLFTVARQNEAGNQALFDRIRATLVMRPSEIIAEEALARLTTPLLDRFLAAVRQRNDAWGDLVIHQLRKRIGTRAPLTWTIRIDQATAPSVVQTLSRPGQQVTLDHLMRDPRDRRRELRARPLLMLRSGREILLPDTGMALASGDRVLFAGRGDARRQLDATLSNVNVLEYLRTGRDLPGGWVWRRFARDDAGAR